MRSGGAVGARVLLLHAVLAVALAGQAPDEAWRTLDTEHFRVSFPAALEETARRAADRAERAHAGLSGLLGWAPTSPIELVVTDHVDVSNGFASVTPWKRITVYARPPVDDETLQYFDDWLELVLSHELAHVFHLDRSGWLGRLARGVVGRYPGTWPFFPGIAQPQWVVEGLPTLYESTLTDAGRLHGSEHEMVVRTAALEGALETLDRASGRSPNWPAGDRPYLYGSRFFDFVVERYGADAIPAFVDATARQWVPYRLDAAGKGAFGVSVSEAWRAWREATVAEARATERSLSAEAPFSAGTAVGKSARVSMSARVSPDGRRLAYARSDGRSDTQIRMVDLATGADRSLTRTNGLATLAWTPDGHVVFAQLEYTDPYRIRSDLWEVDAQGRVRRITRDARLSHPTVAPDGRTVIAVEDGSGGNRLVRVDRWSGSVTPLSPAGADELWTEPRFSPDGRWIAVARWLPGARLDIVVLTPDGRVATEVTADRARDDAPAWSPDGRWLVWASDRTGIPTIVAAPFDPGSGQVGPPRRVAHTALGFRDPEVGARGADLFASAYHADGWRIERLAFEPDRAPPAALVARAGDGRAAAATWEERADAPVGPYRAWRTALPRWWEPSFTRAVSFGDTEVLGPALGLSTGGADVVGRHAWSATARVHLDEPRLEAGASYRFAGLGVPVLGLDLSWTHDAGRLTGVRADSTIATLFTVERDRRADVSVELERRRWRSVGALTLRAGWIEQDRTLLDEGLEPEQEFRLRVPEARFVELGATGVWSTARAFAFSTGPEAGWSALLRVRRRSAVGLADSLSARAGLDGSFDDVVARVRGYQAIPALPGWGHHALALQVVAGVADGPGADDLHFDVGDATGAAESVSGLELFGGRPRLFPVRGYPAGSRFGARAWSAALDYRFPVAEVRRGLGAWPLYLERVGGSLFVDAGNAWGPDEAPFANDRRATLAAVGAELVSDWVPFWTDVLRVRAGVGFPLVDGDGTRVWLRVGTAF